MPRRWQDVEQFTIEMATFDLDQQGQVQPLLVAFDGRRPCFVAFLRGFPKGEYADPMIEVLSLAMALDADRLAIAMAGRLTSLDDPIAPVTADGDLRQRALVVEYADAADGPLARHTLIHPFTHADDGVAWGERVRLSGGQGWIPEVIGLCVQHRGAVARAANDEDIRMQARRCAALGHELYPGPRLSALLDVGDLVR